MQPGRCLEAFAVLGADGLEDLPVDAQVVVDGLLVAVGPRRTDERAGEDGDQAVVDRGQHGHAGRGGDGPVELDVGLEESPWVTGRVVHALQGAFHRNVIAGGGVLQCEVVEHLLQQRAGLEDLQRRDGQALEPQVQRSQPDTGRLIGGEDATTRAGFDSDQLAVPQQPQGLVHHSRADPEPADQLGTKPEPGAGRVSGAQDLHLDPVRDVLGA